MKRFNLMISDDFNNELGKVAKEERRSKSATLQYAFEKYLEARSS